MAYQIPITIKEAISKIQKRQFVLPSIQREFVWSEEQIEKLFDSLMREYPISTFLFWKVEKQKIKDFQFYEFLKDYHEKDARHNTKVDLSYDEDIISILDGQQRLTSLYIALKGSFAKKLPYYRWDSPHAFPKKHLYLNILEPADGLEIDYQFRFLTKEDTQQTEQSFWFEVGKILDFEDISDVMNYLMENGITDSSKYRPDQSKFALNTLSKLFNVIHQRGTLSYYQEEGEELDKVLQIFIRINSGGTKLSYSDLLLSIATAKWKERDAREEIHLFVDQINNIGDGFNFNKDFVLKSCLVLGGFRDVKFKVDNFTKENMIRIENMWESISDSLRIAISLLARFGFSRDNLTSTNAVIPIAYYILANRLDESLISRSNFTEDRKKIKEWLIRVLLKGTFGGNPDALYPVFRNVINKNLGHFPLDQIIDSYKGTNKSIVFTKDDIENTLDIEYRNRRTYSALTLIYPGLNQNFRYHKDHIHPQRFFTRSKLRRLGITDENLINEYIQLSNKLSNLQLLEATENTEKSGKHLIDWLNEQYPNTHDQDVYKQTHLFPSDASLKFEDFIAFSEKRRDLLRIKLAKELGVSLD